MAAHDRIRMRLIPLTLASGVIILDQISKILITAFVPIGERPIELFGDFLWIVHVRNTAIAFNIGRNLPPGTQRTLFSLLPLLVLAGLFLYYLFTNDTVTRFQRWCFAALIGGGLGNYVDRLFRPDGVVDFVSVKFYGIFGLARWPTFNVADSTVVIAGILLFLSFLKPTPAGGST